MIETRYVSLNSPLLARGCMCSLQTLRSLLSTHQRDLLVVIAECRTPQNVFLVTALTCELVLDSLSAHVTPAALPSPPLGQ